MASSNQEELWVLRAQCDDRDALDQLLRSVQPSLRRYVCGLVGPFDADDVLQDVLVAVARKIGWLREAALFRAWAFRIANRAGVRHLKKERLWTDRFADASMLDDVPATESRPSEAVMSELLTMDGISPASRSVLILHFQEELPLADVSALLEIPVGTAKSRLAYGLSSIRRQLAKKGSIR